MTPEELRARRMALGLTQEQLGEIIGKPRNTITRWESGSLAIRDQALLSLALEALERRPRADTPVHLTRDQAKVAANALLFAIGEYPSSWSDLEANVRQVYDVLIADVTTENRP